MRMRRTMLFICGLSGCRGQLKCDGTRAETIFRLSAKRTNPFKSAGERQFSRLLAAEVRASAVVMLDTPCSEIVWRVLDTHSIRQFPLQFPSRASPCAITFELESTIFLYLRTFSGGGGDIYFTQNVCFDFLCKFCPTHFVPHILSHTFCPTHFSF